eukprot:1050730-Ditylum_brightwellii.AAC.1
MQVVNHNLIEACHNSQLYTDNTTSLTMYPSHVFTIDKDLAAVVPAKYHTKDFMIGMPVKPSSQPTQAKKLPLHKLPTPFITPQEASMAFGAINKCKGNIPAALGGHRGNVYVTYVTEHTNTPDTLLGIFCHWKDCKWAVHQVSNAGFEKARIYQKHMKHT